MESKVITRKAFAAIRASHGFLGKRVVFTNGCFDIIHSGHIALLDQAKQYGDVLVVGLNSDQSVKQNKGSKRPILCVEERATILSALQMVDFIIIFDELTPIDVINVVKPDVLAKGEDWKASQIVGAREVESWGGEVVRIPLIENRSTTSIIDRIIRIFCNSPP